MAEATLEIYHQRMSEIQDVSDIIAVANMQINKILTKLSWNRASLFKKPDNVHTTCPIDQTHRLRKDHVQSHTETCMLRKHKITSLQYDDLPVPMLYDVNSAVVPIIVSRTHYEKMGVSINDSVYTSVSSNVVENNVLVEEDDEINNYEPCNSLDELRFIYSLTKIPKRYLVLDITKIPRAHLTNWLAENIYKTNLKQDLKHALINSMFCWLNDVPTPSQFSNCVRDLLGADTEMFVLRLWRFLAAKSLCLSQKIPEHTRNEFEFYGTTSMSTQLPTSQLTPNSCEPINSIRVIPMLPNEWASFNLTTEQKRKVYELVCNSSKTLGKPLLEISQLQSETEEQVRMLTEFDENSTKGEKTRLEVLAELRDYKRRRATYRGKNKSTKKMSAVEVIRELFEQQMLYLKLLQENRKPLTQDGEDGEESSQKDLQNRKPSTEVVEGGEDGREKDGRHIECRDSTRKTSSKHGNRESENADRNRSRNRDRRRSRSRGSRRSRSRSRDTIKSRSKDAEKSLSQELQKSPPKDSPRSQNRHLKRSRSKERRRSRSRGSRRSRSSSRSRRSNTGHYRNRSDERRCYSNSRKRDYRDKSEIANITYYGDKTVATEVKVEEQCDETVESITEEEESIAFKIEETEIKMEEYQENEIIEMENY